MAQLIHQHQYHGGHVFNGALQTASSRELVGLLKMFPKDASLHRALADWLALNSRTATAVETYRRCARLHLEQGKPLPAIAAKLLQWEMVRATAQDVRALYSLLHRCRPGRHPVSDFFIGLDYPGLAAILSVMKLIRVPAGRAVKKFGTVDSFLYFVVSGAFQSTCFMPMQGAATSTFGQSATLRENDIFGNVFPLERENISPSFVKAVCTSEAIRIPKDRLAAACRRVPAVIEALTAAFEAGTGESAPDAARARQAESRRELAVRLTLHLQPSEDGVAQLVLQGHSNNISVGGASVVLVPPQTGRLPAQVTGLETRIQVSLPDDSVTMSIVGRIAWAHPAIVDGNASMVLGIQFKKMTPQMIGYLIVFSEILKKMS